LTNRATVQLFTGSASKPTDTDWVVLDAHFAGWPTSPREQAADLERLRTTSCHTVAEEDGFVLLQKN
jgi:hypothetical protein